MSRIQIICVAVASVIVLGFLTGIGLDKQGPYYDELHQAPAAFHYIGRNPLLFTWAYHGVPLLNMSYSGAIKSTVYGLLLRYGLDRFSITSWRLLGITFVAAGLLAFYLIAGRWLQIETGIVFAALLLTDVTVILTTRHDWGPTAFALALRLVFIALWISLQSNKPTNLKLGLTGLIAGLSVFEKLSSVVLLVPLAVVLLTTRTRGSKSWLAAAVGLFVGASPLLIANVATYRLGQGFISLSNAAPDKEPVSFNNLSDYLYNYLSLGQGQMARTQILGEFSNLFFIGTEAVLVGVALLTLLAGAQHRKSDFRLRFPAILGATYLAVAVGLALLPRATFIHHWIIGTPFQYAAMAFALPALYRRSAGRRFFWTIVICLFVVRIPPLVAVERSLISGKSSTGFAPAFNRLMQLAAVHSEDAIFIASDWGSATQLYCGGNGIDNVVYEPFWGANPDKGAMYVASTTSRSTLYIVTTGLAPQFAEASAAVVKAMQESPDWHSAPMEQDFADLSPIQVLKFMRNGKP